MDTNNDGIVDEADNPNANPSNTSNTGGGTELSGINPPVNGQVNACNPASATLAIKAKGPQVTNLQQILVKLGYSVGLSGADGDFGPNTQAAVIKFQQSKGLTPNGVVDSSTWKALCGLVTSQGTTQPPARQPVQSPDGGQGSGTQTSTTSGIVKWKKYKLGYEGNGGPQVKSELTRLKGENKIQITDDEITIFHLLAKVETGGVMQGINNWDGGVISFGFMQWTLRYGELQDLITRASEGFKTFGIEIEGTYKFNTGTVSGIKGVTDYNVLRNMAWAEKFFKAGLDERIEIAEIEKALDELHTYEKSKGLFGSIWNNHFRNPTAVALIFEAYNNKPVSAKDALQNTLDQTKGRTMTDKEFNDILARNILNGYIAHNDTSDRLVQEILGYVPKV